MQVWIFFWVVLLFVWLRFFSDKIHIVWPVNQEPYKEDKSSPYSFPLKCK